MRGRFRLLEAESMVPIVQSEGDSVANEVGTERVAAGDVASPVVGRVIGAVLLLLGALFVWSAFDLLQGNPSLHAPGSSMLPTSSAFMPVWRLAFGVFLALGAAALTAGWILLRRLRGPAWALVAGSVLGLLGMLAPSALIATVFAVLFGIVLPVALAVGAEIAGRDRPSRASAVTDSPVSPEGVSATVQSTNGLAIASIIVVFFSNVIGLILGHIALSEIRRTGQAGHGLALAAVIIGWISVGIGVVIFVAVLVAVLAASR